MARPAPAAWRPATSPPWAKRGPCRQPGAQTHVNGSTGCVRATGKLSGRDPEGEFRGRSPDRRQARTMASAGIRKNRNGTRYQVGGDSTTAPKGPRPSTAAPWPGTSRTSSSPRPPPTPGSTHAAVASCSTTGPTTGGGSGPPAPGAAPRAWRPPKPPALPPSPLLRPPPAPPDHALDRAALATRARGQAEPQRG